MMIWYDDDKQLRHGVLVRMPTYIKCCLDLQGIYSYLVYSLRRFGCKLWTNGVMGVPAGLMPAEFAGSESLSDFCCLCAALEETSVVAKSDWHQQETWVCNQEWQWGTRFLEAWESAHKVRCRGQIGSWQATFIGARFAGSVLPSGDDSLNSRRFLSWPISRIEVPPKRSQGRNVKRSIRHCKIIQWKWQREGGWMPPKTQRRKTEMCNDLAWPCLLLAGVGKKRTIAESPKLSLRIMVLKVVDFHQWQVRFSS